MYEHHDQCHLGYAAKQGCKQLRPYHGGDQRRRELLPLTTPGQADGTIEVVVVTARQGRQERDGRSIGCVCVCVSERGERERERERDEVGR